MMNNPGLDEMAENAIISLSLISNERFDRERFADNCDRLEKMMTQKTAGQRKGKDISFDELFRVKAMIICDALALARAMKDKSDEQSNT